MAQRAYIIVLEDDGEGDQEWEWFEDCVKQSALDTWDNCGWSAMGHIDLPELEEWSEGMNGPTAVSALVSELEKLQRNIAEWKAE